MHKYTSGQLAQNCNNRQQHPADIFMAAKGFHSTEKCTKGARTLFAIEKTMQKKLEQIANAMREEQRKLLEEAAALNQVPASNRLERIAQLELNIAAVENTLDEHD